MKSLPEVFRDVIGCFNKRVKTVGLDRASNTTKEQAYSNARAASDLLKNSDLGLQYNLYRFTLLEDIEEASTDEERIALAHRVAGIREFITHLEEQEHIGISLRSSESKAQ